MSEARSIARPVIIAAVVAGATMLLGVPLLLGLPGALFARPALPVAEILRGLPPGTLAGGDRAWPLAILMTVLVPPALPVILGIALSTFRRRPDAALATVLGLWLWSVVVVLVLTADVSAGG